MSDSAFVALYLRKSRDKAEVADPELLSKHKRELLRLAESRGDRIPPERIFEEVGSGEKIERRPVFLSLLQEVEALPRGAGGRLYTTEVSRLTRGDLAARGRIQGALQRAQIRHITRGREYDLTSADDRFVWEIEAGVSGYELGRYKQRVAAARVDMAREGRLRTGKPPLGWAWDKNLERPVPNHLFPVVQALCRDALSLSTYELAKKYHIHPQTILNLLRNPFIAGWPAKRWFPHNGERDWVGSSHLLKPDQWIWPTRQADYPAACTLAEWHEIQAALDRRRELREKRNSDSGWCRDVVRFVGYEGLQPRLGTWKCPRVQVLTYELTPRGVPRLYIAREAVHAAAGEALLALLKNSAKLREGLALAERQAQAPIAYADPTREIEALQEDLADLQLVEARLGRQGGGEALEANLRRQRAIEKQIKTLREQAIAARPPIALSDGLQKTLTALEDPAGWWGWCLASREYATLRGLARGLLQQVLVVVEPRSRGVGKGYRREVVGVKVRDGFSIGE